VYCQVLAYKIKIILNALLYLAYLNRLFRAAGYTGRQLLTLSYTVIAAGIQIRNKILEYYPKRAGNAAGFTAGAAHLIAFEVAVRSPL